MVKQPSEPITVVGEPQQLTESFFMALARLILAAHDGERSRLSASPKTEGAAP